MTYRGRLIEPFLVELAQIDTAQTSAAGGYDDVWKAPRVEYSDEGRRQLSVRYKPPIRLRAQVEQSSHKTQSQTAAGNAPLSRYTLVLHFADLERNGLVDSGTGEPTLRVNDTLRGIYTTSGKLVQTFDPPLFVVEVQTAGFGIGGRRNLCLLMLADRAQAVRS